MTTCATCATCTLWRRVAGDDEWYINPRSTAPSDQPWGWCGLIGLPETCEAVTVTAYTQDGSDFIAYLHTRADFGCTLHEAPPSS